MGLCFSKSGSHFFSFSNPRIFVNIAEQLAGDVYLKMCRYALKDAAFFIVAS